MNWNGIMKIQVNLVVTKANLIFFSYFDLINLQGSSSHSITKKMCNLLEVCPGRCHSLEKEIKNFFQLDDRKVQAVFPTRLHLLLRKAKFLLYNSVSSMSFFLKSSYSYFLIWISLEGQDVLSVVLTMRLLRILWGNVTLRLHATTYFREVLCV